MTNFYDVVVSTILSKLRDKNSLLSHAAKQSANSILDNLLLANIYCLEI